MIFCPLGETETISASCHFLSIRGTGILLDAGIDPEAEGVAALPDLDIIHNRHDWYADSLLVTHAHHDHIGALPSILQHFPHLKVHMTHATRDLADHVLPASARLQRRRMREGTATSPPLFSEEEVNVYSYLYLAHKLNESFDVTGLRGETPIRATFYNAGHILGSAGSLLTYADEAGTTRRIFYTSDTNLRAQGIIPGGDYPKEKVDVLILESTLGADPDAELTTRRREIERFGRRLKMIIERGGSALVPVFAMGRAQETLAIIHKLKEKGVISSDIPVYSAGGLRAVSDIYDKTRFTTPRIDESFQMYGIEQRRVPKSTAALMNALESPGIFVVSSGMMFERTLSNRLAQLMVEDEKNGILLVGFAREDSPADRLQRSFALGQGSPVILDDDLGPQPLNAFVERFRMSSHSHRRDLIQLVEKLKPEHVILVHGDAPARTWLADNLRFFYPELNVHVPKKGEEIEI